MPDKNITKQAANILKKELFDQGRYQQNAKYQDNVILAEDNLYIISLVKQLEDLEKIEQEYAGIRAQQDWANYIKNSAVSSPEYRTYKKEKELRETEIKNIQQQYINFTQEQDANNIVTQLELLENINTQPITQVITQQINHMEKIIGRYYTLSPNNYYFNIPSSNILELDGQEAYNKEKELIILYKNLLNEHIKTNVSNMLKNMLPKAGDNNQQKTFDNTIETFLNNQNIQLILNNYANVYAKKIFCEINQKLYSNFGAINLENTNIKFFKTELDTAITEQNLLLTKINLLCQQTIQDKYIIKKDTEKAETATTHLEQIINDIEQLTPVDITKFTTIAKDKFEHHYNYQFLTTTQQDQFVNNLIFIEYQTFLNKQKGIETTLIEQKIKSLDWEIDQKIQSAIVQAGNIPQAEYITTQQDPVQQITGWSTEPVLRQVNPSSNQNTTYSLLDEATAIYNKISGVDRLLPNQKTIFIQQIAIELGKLQQEKDKKWRIANAWNSRRNLGIPKSIKNKTEEIQTAIHTTFEETKKISDKIERFTKEIYITPLINDTKLRITLEKDLANALINFKKNKFNISPIPSFDEEESKQDPVIALKIRLDNIVNRIETAKILTKIVSFNNIPLDQQLKYIDETNKHLLKISILNNKKLKLETDIDTKQDAQHKIIETKKAIEQEQQAIKQIIININLYAKGFIELRKNFNIPEDTNNVLELLKDALATETVQNVAAGVAIGATAVLAAPVLGGVTSNIPFIGSFIGPLANTSLFNVVAGGLIGGFIGTKVSLRKIFKPITYVFEETYDIWKNPNNNSGLDRLIRATAILAPIAIAVVGTGFALAAVANPFSGPVIASVVAGAVATFAVSSLCGWAASKLCKTIRESNLYDEKQAYAFCSGNNNTKKLTDIEKKNAIQLSIFFKQHINEYRNKLATFKANSLYNELEKVHIEKILATLQQAWKDIKENKEPKWDNLLKILYYDKKYGCQKKLAVQIKIADDVTNQLIELVDTPKCVKSRELDSEHLEKIKQKQQAAISFENTAQQLNNFIEKPNTELDELYEISSIIKNRNNK